MSTQFLLRSPSRRGAASIRTRCLRQQLSQSVLSHQCAAATHITLYPRHRTFSTSPISKGQKQDEDPQRKPFHGQVMQTMYDRVQREKVEQQRFAGKGHEMFQGTYFSSLVILLGGAGLGFWAGSWANPSTEETQSTLPLHQSKAPQHNVSRSNLQAAWVEFTEIVGKENVSEDIFDRESHAGSEWSTHQLEKEHIPFAVVTPLTTEEVSKIVKVCHDRKIPITAYSGGTSLEGHFAATRGGICVDFSRMDQIIKINKEDLDCIVQPAVGWERLNEELSEIGLFFPPDPGPGAQIGGMVGTGCSGTNAYRYGTMKEWVLSLTVVMADGTIVKTRQRPRKSSAGYDLTRMFIGSEGTLGLVTEATLKVTTKPANTSVAVCSFPSIRKAADCVFAVVEAGVPIAAIEILDDNQMKCINEAGSTSKQWKEAPTLFFKFAGTSTSVKEHISIVQKLAKQASSKSFEFARNKEEADELWSARKEALWSTMAKRNEGDHVWTTDVAVPISRLPEIIEITKEDISSSGLFATIVGHVGDGNFHAIVLYNDKQRKTAEDLVHRMVKRAIEMEGTATGEHGVGLVKRDALPHEVSEETVAAMRKLKKAFDPLCILNCDKIVRVQQPKKGEVAEW